MHEYGEAGSFDIYVMVHPMAFLYLPNKSTKLFSYFAFKLDEIITESVSLSPRYAYFKCEGKSFSSKTGGDSMERTKGFTSLFEKSRYSKYLSVLTSYFSHNHAMSVV